MRARTMLIIGLVALLAVIGLALMLPTISASVVTTTSSTPSFCVPVTPSCIWAM
ncbi:hypothetical protein [Vulcanisaeta sp. EB80]|uniref:hypothetical protein n=1 Tax=Vulcanisaeta sp. EB80 TaxID=1650660 RepID=UPI001389E902|nr:hypothetical protein [Vulcanisaeta sp. EB80]